MEAKIKTKNKSLRLPTKPKKSLDQKFTPKKIPGQIYTPTIFADYCLIKPPKENTYQIFLPQKILEIRKFHTSKKIIQSSLSLEIWSKEISCSVT